MENPPSHPVIPDHELLRRVARGSYGEVWLARNIMGVFRAVKIIRQESFERARPFERELAGLQRFEPVSRSHESLVQILHAGWLPGDEGFFYVMELADDAEAGTEFDPATYQPRTLRREIDRRGALPAAECLDIALSLVAALHFLHERGLLHRDLKPSNIIFVNGRAKLADIGLVAESSESRSLVGTEGFMPVEGGGTPQADLYALGKLLYEMMTGRDRLEYPTLPAAWVGDATKAPQIEMMEVIYRACDEDWKKRHASAAALQAELALLQSGQSVRRVRGLERRVRWLARAGLAVGAATVLAVGAWGLTERQRRSERQARERIEHAEAAARTQLAAARFARIRAGRHSGQSGCRFDSWATLQEAAREQPTPALRNEAAAVLALADGRPVEWTPAPAQTAAFGAQGKPSQWRAVEGGGFQRFSAKGTAESEVMGAERGKVARLTVLDAAGHLVAAWTDRPGVDVWAVSRKELVLELPELPLSAQPALDITGGRLAVPAEGKTVIIHDLARRAELARWEAPWRANGLAWRPDGKALAIQSLHSRSVGIFNAADGASLGELPHPEAVLDVAWSPDGRCLATAGLDRLVRVWATDGPRPVVLRTGSGHHNVVVGVAWHPQGNLLATASWDGTTRLWDAPSLGLLVSAPGWGMRPSFSEDGRWLVQHSPVDESAEVFEVESARACHWLTEPKPDDFREDAVGPRGVAFSADSSTLATASQDGVRLWSADGRNLAGFLPGDRCTSVAFLPEGKLFTLGARGALVHPLRRDGSEWVFAPQAAPQVFSPRGVVGFGSCLDTPGGPLFTWPGGDDLVVWQQETEHRLPQPLAAWRAVLSPDGKLLTASFHHTNAEAGTWDWRTGKLRWKTPRDYGRAQVAFSPDGRWCALGAGSEVSWWEADTGARGPVFPRAHRDDLSAPLAFSPDGRLFAMAWSRTVARVYDTATQRELITLESPLPFIISGFAFSPDGRHFAIATEGHFTQLWDLAFLRRHLRGLGLDWEG